MLVSKDENGKRKYTKYYKSLVTTLQSFCNTITKAL